MLAKGDPEFCAVLVAVNSVLQIVLYAPFALFYLKVRAADVLTACHNDDMSQRIGAQWYRALEHEHPRADEHCKDNRHCTADTGTYDLTDRCDAVNVIPVASCITSGTTGCLRAPLTSTYVGRLPSRWCRGSS